jgi:hypothetical protein
VLLLDSSQPRPGSGEPDREDAALLEQRQGLLGSGEGLTGTAELGADLGLGAKGGSGTATSCRRFLVVCVLGLPAVRYNDLGEVPEVAQLARLVVVASRPGDDLPLVDRQRLRPRGARRSASRSFAVPSADNMRTRAL